LMVMVLIGMVVMGVVTVTAMRAVTIVVLGADCREGGCGKEEWMWVVDTSHAPHKQGVGTPPSPNYIDPSVADTLTPAPQSL
jgi:hypothetical protein